MKIISQSLSKPVEICSLIHLGKLLDLLTERDATVPPLQFRRNLLEGWRNDLLQGRNARTCTPKLIFHGLTPGFLTIEQRRRGRHSVRSVHWTAILTAPVPTLF